MPIPMGRFNRALFNEEKLKRRLPSFVLSKLRYTELVVEVWNGPIKNKQKYKSVVVVEDGLFVLEPYKPLPPMMTFEDLAYPFKHHGRAYFLDDAAGQARSQHIVVLRRDSVQPKSMVKLLFS